MAAGLGFKTFTTGEVLTAGDVNGYLMQGINVFASEAARDAAITAPAEGQFAFTKDNNSLWYYTGSAWAASGATGDIEGVTAGVGISGGGTSGTVTVTNSMATAIDAKGDLVPGTGADTFARLAVGANGTVLTADSAEATGLKWATPASGSTFAGVRANGPNTLVSNSTTTTYTFDSEVFDTDGFHSNTTNNSRFTIPSGKAGYYEVTYNMVFAGAAATTTIFLLVNVNGTQVQNSKFVSTTNDEKNYTVSYLLNLAVGDYVELKVWQNSGSNIYFYCNAGAGTAYMTYMGA